MSGRLRILPHKSWHVWTTENIEKVKRDERIHKQEIEKSSKKSRDIKSEQLLSQLLANSARNDAESDLMHDDTRHEEASIPLPPATIEDTPINRYSDNLEYKKEKIQKEIQQKRVEGSAPFQLVPDEFKRDNAPWYLSKRAHVKTGSGYHEMTPAFNEESAPRHLDSEIKTHQVLSSLFQRPTSTTSSSNASCRTGSTATSSEPLVIVRGKRLKGQEAADFQDRDLCRKGAADPMSRFLRVPTFSESGEFLRETNNNIALSGDVQTSPELDVDSSHYKKRKKHHADVNVRDWGSVERCDGVLDIKEYDSTGMTDRGKHRKDQRRKKHKKYKKNSNNHGDSRREQYNNPERGSRSDDRVEHARKELDHATLQELRHRRLERERDAKLKTDLHMTQR